tara:strand:+ start:48 stop:1151 length:1104 start_codon:yes stop_codon:yes gene_type:complete
MSFNAPDIRQFKLTGSTLGDVYYPQTALLAPFEGTNGSTSISDLSTRNHSSTFSGSSLSISTSQSKFGSSSLFHNNQSSTTDHVSFGSHSDWLINQNTEYTLEFWYRALDTTTPPVLSLGTYNSAIQYRISCNGDGNLHFKTGTGGWNWGSITISGGTMTVGVWKHVAVVRNSGTLTVYVDGTSIGSASTGNWGNSTGTLRIGTYFGDARSGYFYMDDLRMTRGIARYTGNFTPPTTSHLTSAGDANKQIIVNSSADGVDVGTGGINQARIAKAWVNFNGTGTVAIRSSYNVSSITDSSAGTYVINLSTATADANYSVAGCVAGSGIIGFKTNQSVTRTTSTCPVYSLHADDSPTDGEFVEVQIFGN